MRMLTPRAVDVAGPARSINAAATPTRFGGVTQGAGFLPASSASIQGQRRDKRIDLVGTKPISFHLILCANVPPIRMNLFSKSATTT